MLLNEILFSNNNQFTNHRTKDYFDKLPKNLTYGLPKDVLLIKFNRTTTKEERMDFSNRLRNYFTNDQIYLFDSITMIETSKDFFDYLQLFNIVVAAIALTLSFFLLLVSFISNVRNNSWEIGILRAIGLTEVYYNII
jgi:ABC-type antimicrobial peptide transport system permease subunit